jgi:hypothetical protein
MNSELRLIHSEMPYTREGEPFEAGTLVNFLTKREFTIPSECLNPNRRRVLCIDDGIETLDPRQEIIPFSGSGIGESIVKTGLILDGAEKLKPHRHCGKATLVLSQRRQKLGLAAPTAEEVDMFTLAATTSLGLQLAIPVGRMLDFEDGRATQLRRPVDFHPADGAIIGLSRKFLHNLILPERERQTPAQFRLAGHYYDNDDLRQIAVKEALLALQIASSNHGVGVVNRGFRYTALIDADDSVEGCLKMWGELGKQVEELRSGGAELNQIHLDMIEYSKQKQGKNCRIVFKPLEQ